MIVLYFCGEKFPYDDSKAHGVTNVRMNLIFQRLTAKPFVLNWIQEMQRPNKVVVLVIHAKRLCEARISHPKGPMTSRAEMATETADNN